MADENPNLLKITVGPKSDMTPGPPSGVTPVADSNDDDLIAEWKSRQAVQPSKAGAGGQELLEEYQRRKTQPQLGEGVVAKPGKTPPATDFQQRLNKTSQELLRDFAGRDADIDYSAEAPWSVRYQVGRMDNPSEVRKYLKKFYGDSDFGQDKGGRWWIREGGKKVPIDVGILPGMAASAPTQAGAMVGGAAGGMLGGPAGAIAGAGIGAAGGKAADEGAKFLQGTFSKTPEEEASVLGGEAALNAGMSTLGPLGRGASQTLRTGFFGVTPRSAQTAGKLLERGVRPPIGSVAPDAVGLERKRQLSAAVGWDMGKEKRTGYVENEMRGILSSTGMNPGEVEKAMGQISNNAIAIEGRPAAEGIVESVNRRMTEMDDRITGNLELATRALNHQESAMRAWVNMPVGRLSTESADAIRQARTAVSRQFNRLYEDIDQLAGGEPVVDLTDAIREADTIARQYEFAPGALPQPIRNLLNRQAQIEQAQQQANALQAAGRPVPPELEAQANRLVDRASIAEAHALRSELRSSAKMWNLPNLTPEASYAMVSAVEDHVDNAFATLATSRDPALQLGAEAARNLRRVDGQYREAIAPFKSTILNKIMKDARSGLTPDPEVVAKFIMRPGQDDATRQIISYLSPEARADTTRAHLRGLIGESSYRNEQNQVVVDGKKFLDTIEKNARPMERLYPPDMLADLRRFGAEVAARNGEIEVGALRDPSAIRDMMRRWAMERDAREAFVRENPIAALNSQYGPNVDSALAEISAPKRETKTAALFALLRPEQRQLVQQWAIKTMFQSALEETPERGVKVNGAALRKWTGQYTERQLDMLLGYGVAHDVLELGNDARFLFPDRAMGAGSSQAEVSVTSRGFFNPIGLSKRLSWYLTTLAVHQPQVLRWFAEVHQKDPGKARQLMGAFGRWAVNAESSGPGQSRAPQQNSGGGNQVPRLAEGGVVTQPTVAMIGEAGPEAVVPLDNPAMAQQAADVAAARTRAPYAKAAARPTGLLEGLDEIGGYFGNKLMSAMTAPRDALTGALPVNDTEGMPTPQAMQRGQGVANMAMTGGIPFAQRGAAGMAGGKLGGPGEPQIIPPSSPKVQQAIDRLKAWLPINERNGPAPALRTNIQIMERGGPMAERMAEHTLKTWDKPPTRAIEPPTIDVAPSTGARINFQSAGAQRGEPGAGTPRPQKPPMTLEEKAEWGKRADAEMEAHIAKMAKTKEGRKAILDAAKQIEKDPGAGRINFKSLETEK